MLKWRLQYFGHLGQSADSFEKTLMLGKIEGRKKGWWRMRWLDGITDSIDMSLAELRQLVMDRDPWRAVVHWVTKSRTWLSTELNWTELCILVKQAEWQCTSLYFFPSFEPVFSSMSDSNSCILPFVHVSQETGKVVWYSNLFKNLQKLVVIHTVKGFSMVNEADKTLCATGPREKGQWPHKNLSQTCLWVFGSPQPRHESTVACCRVRGPGSSSPGRRSMLA